MNSNGLRRACRVVLSLIATLQVVVAMGGPWVDARFEARSQGAVAHVESTTTPSCVAIHDHNLCALCRELGRSKLPSSGSALIVAAVATAIPPAALVAQHVTRDLAGPLGSRAPPQA